VTIDGPKELGARFAPQDLVGTTTLPAPKGKVLGAKGFGGNGNDNLFAIATDHEGNVLVTGSFQQSANLGGSELQSAGGSDIIVAKYASSGAHLWSRQLGGAQNDFGKGIVADRDGSAFVIGSIESTDKAGLVSEDLFLAKFSPTGMVLWGKRFGSSGRDVGHAVTIDAQGNPIITGEFSGTVDFGGGPRVAIRRQDIVVAKFSGVGAHIWSKGFGGDGQDIGYAIGAGETGDVAVAGVLSGIANLGGGAIKSAGEQDAFLLRLAPDGTFVWSKGVGGPGNDSANALQVDSFGQIAIVGDFRDSVDFGGGPLASAGGQDIFVAKYSPTGTHIWSQRFGGADADVGRGLAVDQDGNFAITGSFSGDVAFAVSSLRSRGSAEGFVAKLSPRGAALWSMRFGGPGSDFGFASAVDRVGNVSVAGSFHTSAEIGGTLLAGRAGSFDVFVLRVGP
jgi:hypothetical protein